jgi:hypothetical protein
MNLILGVCDGCSTEQEIPFQAWHASCARLPERHAAGVEPTTGEVHLRHHVSPSGFYRGKKVVKRVRASDSFWVGQAFPVIGELPAFSFVCQRMTITVAIDCMGGDHGPLCDRSGSTPDFVRDHSDVRVILVGLAESIRPFLGDAAVGRIAVRHATEVVAMDESPALALRTKKDSSMRVAINLVKQGEADACVSAGQHRCADGHFPLRPEDAAGYRPTGDLCSLPTLTGHTHVLDLGANVDCSPGASAAVRDHGRFAGFGHRASGSTNGRDSEHRRGRYQGQ